MNAAGFKRLSLYAAPELDALLIKERQSGECMGRTLERLLLGQAIKRHDYYTRAEMAARAAKRAARFNRPMHGLSMEMLSTYAGARVCDSGHVPDYKKALFLIA